MSGAALRRADWRFLLPGDSSGVYEHLVVLGGPAGLAAALREAGAARRVSDRLPPEGGADAIALLADAAATLEAAAGALTPGGALYLEVDRRRPGRRLLTPAALERGLRRAGLTVTGRHWVIPGFARARRFLPLDAPAALDWYLTTLQPAKTRLAHLAVRGLRRLSGGVTARLAPWVPCYGVTAVAGAPRLPALLGRADLPRGPLAPGTRTALITSGEDDGSRVVLLPFAPGAAAPSIALKASRLERFNAHTEREHAMLCRLRSLVEPAMRQSLPEPLGCLRHGPAVVGIETVAPGRAMTVSSGRHGAPVADAIEDLRAAAAWLAAFHRQAPAGSSWTPERAEATARRIGEYEARLAPRPEIRRLLGLVAQRALALAGHPLPIVWLHNDYGPWNIYRDGGRLTVIDWEFGGEDERDRQGPPLVDLIYFATVWSARVWRLDPASGEARAVGRLFADPAPADEVARAAHRAIEDYRSELAIDPRFVPLLLVHTWLERALDRSDRRGESAPNPYADCLAALAPAAERLFA